MKIIKPLGARNAVRDSTKNEGAPETEPVQEDFPVESLGPVLLAMVDAVCMAEKTPKNLGACCALGIVSSALGAGLQVQSGAGRTTRGGLYVLGSGESGSGKSETFRYFAKPFQQFNGERIDRWYKNIRPGLVAEKGVLETEVFGIKKDIQNPKSKLSREEQKEKMRECVSRLQEIDRQLKEPTLYCEDVTTEKLAALLAENGEQMSSLSPDAVNVVNNLLGRYSPLKRTDEGVYLKSYSGDACRVDRKSSDPILLQSPCLAALWLTQPDKLESLLAERSLSEGGLIPRMLICHTNCEPQEIDDEPRGVPEEVTRAYAALIVVLLETYRLAGTSQTIRPEPEALQALNSYHNAIVRERKGELRDVTSFAARWSEQAWRIGVCLHAALHGGSAHEHPLALDTAQNAIRIAEWFARQQLEILSAGRDKAKRQAWDEVLTLVTDKPQGITARDVQRARIRRDAETARALLSEMEAMGKLASRDVMPEGGGCISRVYVLPGKA